MVTRLIVGLGTGRCGTSSLAFFLNNQPGTRMVHEGMIDGEYNIFAWQGDALRILSWLEELHRRWGPQRFVGDIGMYFLPYVETILARFPDARFVCLERPKEQVVASYLRHVPEKHHWTDHDGTQWQRSMWDPSFPSFPETDKRACLERYWELYAVEVARLVAAHPGCVRRFATDALNTRDGRAAILDFVGHDGPRRIHGDFRKNAKRPRWLRPWQRLQHRALQRVIDAGRRTLPATWRHWLWVRIGYRLYT